MSLEESGKAGKVQSLVAETLRSDFVRWTTPNRENLIADYAEFTNLFYQEKIQRHPPSVNLRGTGEEKLATDEHRLTPGYVEELRRGRQIFLPQRTPVSPRRRAEAGQGTQRVWPGCVLDKACAPPKGCAKSSSRPLGSRTAPPYQASGLPLYKVNTDKKITRKILLL
jgi:hypothetical protein